MTTRPLPDSILAAMGEMRAEAAQQAFWRGLDELEGAQIDAHAPTHEPVNWRRREFMKLMAASLALAGTPGCSRPPLPPSVPYRERPPASTYAHPVSSASALHAVGSH